MFFLYSLAHMGGWTAGSAFFLTKLYEIMITTALARCYGVASFLLWMAMIQQ